MKKLLALFVVLDLIFVGLILKVMSKGPERTISSIKDDSYTDLSDGQKNKWDLVETFKFQTSADSVTLTTDKLQIICDTSSLIELQFSAQDVAFAGGPPLITHVYSCESIRKDQAQTQLQTTFVDFKKVQQSKKIDLGTSQLRGSNIYSDEEFPVKWKLTAVRITGPSTFTINEYEIEKVLAIPFEFNLPTSAK